MIQSDLGPREAPLNKDHNLKSKKSKLISCILRLTPEQIIMIKYLMSGQTPAGSIVHENQGPCYAQRKLTVCAMDLKQFPPNNTAIR